MVSIVDLDCWPVADLSAPAARRIIATARASIESTGCASFERFLRPDAVVAAAAEVEQLAPSAFVTDAMHNAYQLPHDAMVSDDHVRNQQMRTRVASSAWDELGRGSVLQQLYLWDGLPEFIGAVTGRPTPYRLADPLGCCSVNVFRPGWWHAWHFDEAEFTTTVCLQDAEVGGEFEFTPPIRQSDDDLAEGIVAATVRSHSEFMPVTQHSRKAAPVTTASFAPGTLQIFAGRYCLHRVTQISGSRDRLVGVLCFASEPGVVNSPEVQKMFWGRTAMASL